MVRGMGVIDTVEAVGTLVLLLFSNTLMTALQKLRPVAKFRVHVSQQRKGTKVLLHISRNTPLFALRMVKTAAKKDGHGLPQR